MKYIVDVHGVPITVELDASGARVAGREVTARLADVDGTPEQVMYVGDTVHRIVAVRGGSRGRYTLWIDGWCVEAEALDERARAIREMAAASAAALGPAPLVAPMPGLVVRVLVAEGADVQAGDPLVVMEAMKMENELRAPSAGRVARVRVAVGTPVDRNAVLIELE